MQTLIKQDLSVLLASRLAVWDAIDIALADGYWSKAASLEQDARDLTVKIREAYGL
jgi:hypothetical protein